MEINQKHVNTPAELNSDFERYIEQLRCPHDPRLLRDFFQAMMPKFPLGDWVGRPAADLFNAIFDFFNFVNAREQGNAAVRVYTPELENDGWLCGRSVVLFCCDDSPFLVDSVRMVLEDHELAIRILKSTVLDIQRSEHGVQALALASADAASKETFAYFEISLVEPGDEAGQLEQSVRDALQHVEQVVKDYEPMLARLEVYIDELLEFNIHSELVDFLRWLRSSNFTFLGYRDLDFDSTLPPNTNLGARILKEDTSKMLGIFNAISLQALDLPAAEFSEGARTFYETPSPICFSKSATRSSVHRNVYPDYIVLKKYDAEGNVLGECRFLGFYTYAAASKAPGEIPLLRKKVDFIMQASGLDPRSHDGKRLLRHIDLHPKDELFQASEQELYHCLKKVIELNERDIVRLIIRQDPFEQFVSCLVYVPRELYTTSLRLNIQSLLGDELGSHHVDATTLFSESKHARAHLVYRVSNESKLHLDIETLEKQVVDLAYGWQEHFHRALEEHFGERKAKLLSKNYGSAFPKSYQESFDARSAAQDIEIFESLNAPGAIALQLYQPKDVAEDELKFRIARVDDMIELSDVIPILEHLGLRVLGEQPHRVLTKDGRVFWLHDFHLRSRHAIDEKLAELKPEFEEAFSSIWRRERESDGFNQLVLAAGCSIREVNLLRAYANYMRQTLFLLSLDYIAETLVAHPAITQYLLTLFAARFDPEKGASLDERRERCEHIITEIERELDKVAVLNQDKIVRRFLGLIRATLRTSYYLPPAQQPESACIVLKFSPKDLDDIPEPKPLYEFFVYSARVEGVHLRTSAVARGGLRWSDRFEDYRTEILGLVKAQQVKNSVIVPSGAKGGFVCKQMPINADRETSLREGKACYRIFIRAMLRLTDFLDETGIRHPDTLVCYDGDDAYLVVAADKGTATFSDIANEIAAEETHWLGDAFASGGSRGYDHKAMGITAKGAWVSVQRHFRERGIDVQRDAFTAVGIGDMAGDVFGNGMLLSRCMQLVAAFNHQHIFIDPNPETELSFKERERLFQLPGSSWADYDKTLLSEGGGIFSRQEKSIHIHPKVAERFALQAERMAPSELISTILKAPVDLIWNGGIGTYVKSSSESHAEVGDKANDVLRVDGRDLRCQVFGEGGNLGMTQRGRVEFCLAGGACNTDFIDNVGGVDCSDHEVNIKILLNHVVANGDLTEKQRNQLLVEMTDDVTELVLENNRRQTLALSIAEIQAKKRAHEYRRFIHYLETQNQLDRNLEFLPSDTEIVERIGRNQSLTRPELAVLLSYAKVQLKHAFALPAIADNQTSLQYLYRIFPAALQQRFAAQLNHHRLRKEIVATQLANAFIHNLGISAYQRLSETTGSSAEEVAKAYMVASRVFRMDDYVDYICDELRDLNATQKYEFISIMMRRVRRATRWFLKNRRSGIDIDAEILSFSEKLAAVQRETRSVLPELERQEYEQKCDHFSKQGIAETWVPVMAMPDNLFSGLGVVEVSNTVACDVAFATQMFIGLQYTLKLNWFASQLSEMNVENYWQASARESYIDDLESQLRKLSILLVKQCSVERPAADCIAHWLEQQRGLVDRWESMLAKVESTARTDYAMFAVALRELHDLVSVTAHSV